MADGPILPLGGPNSHLHKAQLSQQQQAKRELDFVNNTPKSSFQDARYYLPKAGWDLAKAKELYDLDRRIPPPPPQSAEQKVKLNGTEMYQQTKDMQERAKIGTFKLDLSYQQAQTYLQNAGWNVETALSRARAREVERRQQQQAEKNKPAAPPSPINNAAQTKTQPSIAKPRAKIVNESMYNKFLDLVKNQDLFKKDLKDKFAQVKRSGQTNLNWNLFLEKVFLHENGFSLNKDHYKHQSSWQRDYKLCQDDIENRSLPVQQANSYGEVMNAIKFLQQRSDVATTQWKKQFDRVHGLMWSGSRTGKWTDKQKNAAVTALEHLVMHSNIFVKRIKSM